MNSEKVDRFRKIAGEKMIKYCKNTTTGTNVENQDFDLADLHCCGS